MQNLGRGFAGVKKPTSLPKFFNFTKSLPDGFLFIRSDTTSCATYRDPFGKLKLAAANIPRFDHTSEGNLIGLLIEGQRTNKLPLANASPLSTTGFLLELGSAVLSVVNDSFFLNRAGLGEIGNGNVLRIDNTAGTISSLISITTQFGNTNAHSFSLWSRSTSQSELTRSGSAASSRFIEGNSYRRYRLENITGHSAGDRIQMKIPPGGDLYIILYQLEEGSFSSSEIITSGAAATRSFDRVRVAGLNTVNWWNSKEGYILATYRPFSLNLINSDQNIVHAHDGTVNNCIGMRINRSAEKDFVLNIRNSSVLSIPGASLCPHTEGAMHRAFMAWKSDKIIARQGGVTKTVIPSIAMPQALTELSVGSRNGGSDPLWGWIESIEIGKNYIEKSAVQASDYLVFGAGQSLMKGLFHSQATNSSSGHDVFCRTLSAHKPLHQCIFADGSTGGSAASKTSDATKYWWDASAEKRGPVFEDFYDYIKDAGFVPNVVLWSQGEADSHFIGGSTSAGLYKHCLEKIFQDMRQTLGDIKVFIQPIGRRSAATGYLNIGGIQKIREIQKEISADNPAWCRLSAESYDQPLYDDVHLSDSGYRIMAERHAAVIGGNESSGPKMIAAQRNGAVVTVTLVHSGGANNFSPANAISGFHFIAGGQKIEISSSVKLSESSIQLVLAQIPGQGQEILYYGYDGMSDLIAENVVRDNSPLLMPLKTGKLLL